MSSRKPSRKPRRSAVQARRIARKPEPPAGKAPPSKGSRVDPEILKLRRYLLSFSGVIKGLPHDFALNHDHYIHGTPKR